MPEKGFAMTDSTQPVYTMPHSAQAASPRTGAVHSYRSWYEYGISLLSACEIADAKTDAWLLLEHTARISHTWYLLHRDELMSRENASEYNRLLTERSRHVPLQYLTGHAWFYGNCFSVTPDVLIPRQDTETLVEEAEKMLEGAMHILDMCTGSGCILLSLLNGHPDVDGIGTDLSPAALEVARKNRDALKITPDRAAFLCGDLFASLPSEERFDMILSNPPYIRTDVIASLDPEVRDHEPHQALDGRASGLYFEQKIADEARSYFRKERDGYLFLEIGYDQGPDMQKILERLGYRDIRIAKDLGGNDRVAYGCFRP